jgi:hypothetical protein|tara:strand:+ start:34 stop:312 length:279 start_codon:yes stop_codon:yes gene_type:complete
MVYTIKSSAVALSDTASTVSSANRVLLQNTGTAAALVTIKSDDTFQSGSAAVQGTVYVQAGADLLIKKDRLFTLEVASSVTTLYATSVGVEG